MTATAAWRGRPSRANKYHAKTAFACPACDGALEPTHLACPACGGVARIRFHSMAERQRYFELRVLEKADHIEGLRCQVAYPIHVVDMAGEIGQPKQVGKYIADFIYYRDGQLVVEDTKGVETQLFRFKRRCIEAEYGIKISIVKAR